MGIQARVGARAVGGLLALTLAAAGCSTSEPKALKVTGGALADPSTTTAAPPEVVTTPETTAAPAPRRVATTRRATTRPATPAGPTDLTLKDTGLTRVRVTIENQARWATVSLHGTDIKTSRVVEASGGTRVTSLGPELSVAEAGRAVIELVLSVPTSAQTSLSMCKNIHGPATVTITRLTDAPTTIATLTSYASEPRTANRCEGYADGELGRPALIGPVRWPARHDPRPLVLANFYPWYDTAALGQNFGDQPTGPADTASATSVTNAVELASTHGVDGFIVEWEGTSTWDSHIDNVYRAAAARSGFTTALMLDFAILKGRHGALSGSVLDTALAAVTRWAGQPSQLKVGDQPVVFIYQSELVRPTDWAAALERLRVATGLRPFVVVDSEAVSGAGRHKYSTNSYPDVARLLRWAAGELLNLRAQPGLIGEQAPLWVAPVSPGYDDRRLNRSQHTFVDRRGTQRYDESWSAALDTLPDWVVVTSWNEYYEQTHVMPGTTTGSRALERTAAWAARFHATG